MLGVNDCWANWRGPGADRCLLRCTRAENRELTRGDSWVVLGALGSLFLPILVVGGSTVRRNTAALNSRHFIFNFQDINHPDYIKSARRLAARACFKTTQTPPRPMPISPRKTVFSLFCRFALFSAALHHKTMHLCYSNNLWLVSQIKLD